MPELSYREAVRDTLSRAMRDDDDVFIMGEDIAEMGGSMAVTQGMLAEFGPERVRNTPISEAAIMGAGVGAALQGMRPVVEIMYEDFLTLSTEQLINQAAKHRYMSGGQVKVPLTVRTQGGVVTGRAARAATRGLVRPYPGPEGRLRLDRDRRPRPALVGDLRRQPRRLLRAQDAVRPEGRGAGRDRADPAREGAHPPRGGGRYGRRDGPARPRVARGGGRGREGGHLGGGARPAHPAAARRGVADRLGQEDEPLRRRPRGCHAHGLRRRG